MIRLLSHKYYKLQNLRTVSVGSQHFGETVFSLGTYSLGIVKTPLSPSSGNPAYVNTYNRIGKLLTCVVGIFLDSMNNIGNEYAHIGDGGGAEPKVIDTEGFWVYHNFTKPAWISAICIFKN